MTESTIYLTLSKKEQRSHPLKITVRKFESIKSLGLPNSIRKPFRSVGGILVIIWSQITNFETKLQGFSMKYAQKYAINKKSTIFIQLLLNSVKMTNFKD